MKKLFSLLAFLIPIFVFGQSTTPTWAKTINAGPAAAVTKNVSLTNTGTFGVKSTGVIKLLTGGSGSIFSYKRSATDSSFLQPANFSNKTSLTLKSVSPVGSSYFQAYGGYGALISAEGIINNAGVVIDTLKVQIQSAYAGFVGAKYDQDYSANYISHSLVDSSFVGKAIKNNQLRNLPGYKDSTSVRGSYNTNYKPSTTHSTFVIIKVILSVVGAQEGGIDIYSGTGVIGTCAFTQQNALDLQKQVVQSFSFIVPSNTTYKYVDVSSSGGSSFISSIFEMQF